ncbi:MAG: FAD-dependent oxidoreductase, partial [Pseudomonadota bacterium]
MKSYDYVIVGAGIIGMAVARELKKKYPQSTIIVLEKEKEVGEHSSGRNSGVLHSGFYYSADSLKARFTVQGNRRMKDFCRLHKVLINECQKVVVAQTPEEVPVLDKLFERGKKNGVDVSIISPEELKKIDPNAKTIDKALFSPTTATVDPAWVCKSLQEELQSQGVHFSMATRYLNSKGHTVFTSKGEIEAGYFINCAGLYADQIAQEWGMGKKYTIIPFKGIYLKYTGEDHPIRTNIYPVPNLKNPFLGVHFTITHDGHIKIGPTAIPAFWRENYQGWDNFKIDE